MTSLISDSIKAMGDPNEASQVNSTNSSNNVSTNSLNSISYLRSFQDWWTSPKQLVIDSKLNLSQQSKDTFKSLALKNKLIEYDLFRTILSNEIYIVNPGEVNNLDNKDPQTTQDYKAVGELIDVELDDGTVIHEFYLKPLTPSKQETHIVIIHGYMAAIGYFVKNIEDLLNIPGVHLHLIDLPGFGNSMRPKFPSNFLYDPESIQDKIQQILDIENWFIDRIENWRKLKGLTKFKLIAHSMGAYLSSCYIMKYNNQSNSDNIVDDFAIVSPMGTESSEFSLINDPKYQFNLHSRIDPFEELHFDNEDNEDVFINDKVTSIWRHLGKPKFPKNLILRKLWQYNKSPFELLQKTGPFYSKILSYWSFQRFKNFNHSDDTIDLILKLHNYSYSIFNQFQGSGELAITKLINSEILAKLPLCDRGLIDYLAKNKIRTLWIYGEHDWMNAKGGEHIHTQINEKFEKLSQFEIVDKAGHHIYLDNPMKFNQIIINFFNLSN